MSPARLVAIWAQDQQRIIGNGTEMLWRVPADLAFFKATTQGAPVVMGRASWEALGGPLPGRANIVITRQSDYQAPGAVVVHSLDQALAQAQEAAAAMGADTVWITGGAQVYAATIDMVEQLVVTQLDLTLSPLPDAVALAPVIDPAVWSQDAAASDADWRPLSGSARWKVGVFNRIHPS